MDSTMENIKTVAEELIEKFGKDNIFLVDADYHGLYHDDVCNFTYWNNVNGTMPIDRWTTAYACPHYGRFECMTLKEGVEKGLVDTQKLLEYLKATQNASIIKHKDILSEPKKFATIGLRIEAYKGRKWRGIGYWVGERRTSYTWAAKLWKSDNDYGTTTTNYCKIYDLMTGRIEHVNAANCRLLDIETLEERYIKKYNFEIGRCREENIVYGIHGPYLKPNIETFEDFIKHEGSNSVDLLFAYDEFEIEMRRKAMEFRSKKMPELIEWVKNNTDKEGNEILKLAESIFKKKYL